MSKQTTLSDKDRLTLLSELQFDFEYIGAYKSLKEYSEIFSVPEEEMRQHIESVLAPMQKRGMPLPDFLNTSSEQIFPARANRPDPTFMMVAQSVLDVNDTRSLAAKIKEFAPLGVTSKTWTNWMENPVNADYFDTLLKRRFDQQVERSAQLAISRSIAAGDLPTIKWYYELTNKYRPQNENVQSLAILMQMVLQVLAKHVPMDVIDAVADEIELLPINQTDPLQITTGK